MNGIKMLLGKELALKMNKSKTKVMKSTRNGSCALNIKIVPYRRWMNLTTWVALSQKIDKVKAT